MGRSISYTLQLFTLHPRILSLYDDPHVCPLHYRGDPSHLLRQKRLRLQLSKLAHDFDYCPYQRLYASDNRTDIRVFRVDI